MSSFFKSCDPLQSLLKGHPQQYCKKYCWQLIGSSIPSTSSKICVYLILMKTLNVKMPLKRLTCIWRGGGRKVRYFNVVHHVSHKAVFVNTNYKNVSVWTHLIYQFVVLSDYLLLDCTEWPYEMTCRWTVV